MTGAGGVGGPLESGTGRGRGAPARAFSRGFDPSGAGQSLMPPGAGTGAPKTKFAREIGETFFLNRLNDLGGAHA